LCDHHNQSDLAFMSITISVNEARPASREGQVVVTTKIDLIRHGLVCGRPWWIADPELSRWTSWTSPPPGVREYSAEELIECRRVAVQLNTYLHQDRSGDPIETTEVFHALEDADRDDATTRLGAAIAGQLAWSVFDVPALHHVAWMAPDLGLDAGTGGDRVDYAGLATTETPSWVVLDAAVRTQPEAGARGDVFPGVRMPDVRAIGGASVTACAAAIAVPGQHAGALDARPTSAPAGPDLDGIDADRLDEQRYAPFARAIAAGTQHRTVKTSLASGHPQTIHLFPLGFTGFIGVSDDLWTAIHAALDDARPEGRGRFAQQVRAIHRQRARDAKPPTARKVVNRRSRTTSRLRTAPQVDIDGVRHEVSVGPDGIALVLPIAVTQMNADRHTGVRAA
jgi:hypothetical protein